MFAALVGAREAATKALNAIEAEARRFGILGAEGTGKSGALDLVEEKLRAKGRQVFRLDIGRGDDAAFAALVSLAGQVERIQPGLLSRVRDDRVRYTQKLDDVARALENSGATLLIDDPPVHKGDLIGSVFDDRLAEIGERLLALREVRVVVASRHRFPGAYATIHRRFDPVGVLEGPWSPIFGAAAASLGGIADLRHYSPVETRLVVAAVAHGRPPKDFVEHRWDPSGLLEIVLADEAPLRRVVGALAFVRTPFREDLLDALGAGDLPSRSRALLDEVLLLRADSGRVLHGLIARRARGDAWLTRSDQVNAHATLAQWHRKVFEESTAANDLPRALRHEIEHVHHLTESGDLDGVLSAKVYFPEQYDALGKSLSVSATARAVRHSDAVRAFERAVSFDEPPDRIDAYAHHYLAYNLDIDGEQEDRVLSEYVLAQEVQPTHPWFWGRRICFLITTGRLDDAMDVWSEAASSFQLDEGEEALATELHRGVAHLLVHRGQIKAARRVLRDVPRGARTCDWYVSLDSWLDELELADRDELVFPPHIPAADRWKGPHLLRDPSDADRVLGWQPGRISSSDAGGLRVRIGARNHEGRVTFAYRDLSHEDLARLSTYPKHGLHLPAGTFVEILEMKDADAGRSEQLLSWPRQSRRLAGLPPIFPRPDRYIRRALARP